MFISRQLALHLCDWDVTEAALALRLSKLSSDGEPERAAAMALFNNKLSWTIDILSGAQNFVKKTANGTGVNTGKKIYDSFFEIVFFFT